MDDKQRRLTKLVFDDINTINQSIPSETVTLKLALEGRREIRLRDNSCHIMDYDELRELAGELPSWMKWIVRVPITLAYNLSTGTLKVLWSEWEEKAIRRVLGIEDEYPINLMHLEKLIMKFSSLIFVIFDVRVSDIVGGDEYEGLL